jgi:DNA-binding FrmR family transcriptional regulator
MNHDRKNILIALKKARGTLEKVISMTEDNLYCADIAHQINATM